ncbi:B3 domain-containing protein Os01g0234100-like isoform X1 [Vitis riparia]|uniref:B3 domain-containing protein Os01g0234100-like isoform X1 n=1 Tax=Vitis riparia TaxID=96939 RepID=UPI00155A3CCC|nr:B3 domain-containing protein Os01g0234100-like isoform X1 [Vitis riparia]
MGVDQNVVKQEVEDEVFRMASSRESRRSREEDVTLAQLSQTVRTFAPSTPQSLTKTKLKSSTRTKQKKCVEKKEKGFGIKRRRSTFKLKHEASDHSPKSASRKRNKAAVDGSSTPLKAKTSALIRAEEVQSNLGPEFPSFVKVLVRSHVSSCFWMGLPGPFCDMHLPKKDVIITLEDESGAASQIKYIADKTGLSAGWRRFSMDHKLLEGDVLVFHLVEPTSFKVYIIRANDLTEVDGALGLLELDTHTKSDAGKLVAVSVIADLDTVACKSSKRKHSKSLPLVVFQKKNRNTGSIPNLMLREQSENDSEGTGSEVLEGSKFFEPAVQFKDISFDNFNILVDGLLIDSELPEDTRAKYYELCCSQNAFLHEKIVEGLNCRLIAEIISQTVQIADTLRACKLTTSRVEFTNWERTLKAFEVLGMNVGFLQARLDHLVSLAFDSEGAMYSRQYMEVTIERAHAEDEMRDLEDKLMELKAASERMDADIETLKEAVESHVIRFQEEVVAPW